MFAKINAFITALSKDKLNSKIVNQSQFGKWFPFPIDKKYKDAATKYNWAAPVQFGKSLTKPKDLPLELCVESCLVPQREINTTANAKRIAEMLTRKIQKSEAQLKKNEAFLQNLIHAIPDLIWLKDKEGVYLTCNSRWHCTLS